MNLFLLRHADAAPGIPDEERALSETGYAQIEKLARLADPREFVGLTAIEHSPYRRAAQTAARFKALAHIPAPLKILPGITPDDDIRETAALLAKSPHDRMLVGHNPHFETLAGMLLGRDGPGVSIAFAKSGLMALRRFSPATGRTPFGYWQLLWFITP